LDIRGEFLRLFWFNSRKGEFDAAVVFGFGMEFQKAFLNDADDVVDEGRHGRCGEEAVVNNIGHKIIRIG